MTGHKTKELKEFESRTLGYVDRLHRFGVHLTGNTADADDLVQETYLKAFRYWKTFVPGTNIQAWLFRILKNSFINQYRKDARRGVSVEYAEGDPSHRRGQAASKGDARDGPTFSNLLDDDIAGALSRLSDRSRTVLILYDIEGLTYDEIAGFMMCPLGTVRSRLHRARRSLRLRLVDHASGCGRREAGGIPTSETRLAVGAR